MPPRIEDLPRCGFYACRNPQHDDPSATLTLQIEGEEGTVVVNSCLYHAAILSAGPTKYVIGRTFNNDIEVRPVAAVPTPPAEPQGEPE